MRGPSSTSISPAPRITVSHAAHGRAPAIQPVQRSMSWSALSGIGFAAFVGQLIEDGPVVAEPDGVLSTGMEMVGGFRLLRDVSVLLLDFVAKFLHIDKIKDVCHRC